MQNIRAVSRSHTHQPVDSRHQNTFRGCVYVYLLRVVVSVCGTYV